MKPPDKTVTHAARVVPRVGQALTRCGRWIDARDVVARYDATCRTCTGSADRSPILTATGAPK